MHSLRLDAQVGTKHANEDHFCSCRAKNMDLKTYGDLLTRKPCQPPVFSQRRAGGVGFGGSAWTQRGGGVGDAGLADRQATEPQYRSAPVAWVTSSRAATGSAPTEPAGTASQDEASTWYDGQRELPAIRFLLQRSGDPTRQRGFRGRPSRKIELGSRGFEAAREGRAGWSWAGPAGASDTCGGGTSVAAAASALWARTGATTSGEIALV